MNKITLSADRNETAKIIHRANIKWWQDIDTGNPIERNQYELLALVVSELSECLEGERKNLMDDKLPHRRMAEVEMADAWIRLMDFEAGFAIRLFSDPDRLEMIKSENKGEGLFDVMSSVIGVGTSDSNIDSDFSDDVSYALDMVQSYCNYHGYDLEGAINEKMTFNAAREDHTHEARRIAGGKQF